MKIAFISDFFYPSIGGTQMLCKCIAEYFHNLGHEINIITSYDPNRDLTEKEYKIIQLDNLNFTNRNILDNNNYDHVFLLADMFSAPLATIDFNSLKKSTIILNLDENIYRAIKTQTSGFTADTVNFLLNQLRSVSNIVSFCKDAPVNKFLDENQIKYNFIANFSRDTNKSSLNLSLRKVLNLKDKKIIFNHGNIEYRKNQLSLIEAFKKSKIKDDFCLVLMGSPRTKQDEQYLRKINISVKDSDDIFLIKGSNNMDLVDSLLRQSDVFVLPSLAEGLPLVLLEAMSAGLPWVSTPCGGVPGVMGEMESGIVLEDFTLDKMFEAVRMVENKNSREEWENNFTEEKCCKKYEDLL